MEPTWEILQFQVHAPDPQDIVDLEILCFITSCKYTFVVYNTHKQLLNQLYVSRFSDLEWHYTCQENKVKYKELAAFMTNIQLLANYVLMCKKIPRNFTDTWQSKRTIIRHWESGHVFRISHLKV